MGGSKNVQKVADVINGWSKIDHPTDRPTKPHANGQKLTMNFRNFFISFVFISPGIFYSSYKFIQHKHWQFSCKWASCNSYRYFSKIVTAVVCKTLKNLWPTSLVLGGLLLFFGLLGEWVVSVWKWSTILIFRINIERTLIDSMSLFNARLFCNSVHLMNL